MSGSHTGLHGVHVRLAGDEEGDGEADAVDEAHEPRPIHGEVVREGEPGGDEGLREEADAQRLADEEGQDDDDGVGPNSHCYRQNHAMLHEEQSVRLRSLLLTY